jgi:PTS system nitrogen regulatory IIA component
MRIRDFLAAADVAIDVRASDKVQLLRELSQRAAGRLDLPADRVVRAILDREGLGSTGVGGGIALPHARLEEVKAAFGLLARLRRPIEFEAVDGKPVDLVFLLLLPAKTEGEQLNVLATVARRLRDAAVLDQLRRAGDPQGLYQAFAPQS